MYIIRFSTRYVESACTAERFRRYCCTNAVLHFHRRRTEPVCFRKLYSLKQECHFDEILVTGCTASCHFDNFRCSQWRKFHQNGISVSVFMGLAVWISTFIPEENGHHFCRRHFRKHFPECKSLPLQWRHNGHDGVSNHQHRHCLLNRLFRCRSKKASELLVTGLCAGNSPVTGEFPTQMASNAENVSIWWRHHADFTEVGKHCWSFFSTREDFNYLCHLNVMIWSKIQIYFMFARINSARLGLIYPLQWRVRCDSVSNHRRLGCLLSRLFRRRAQTLSKFRVTGLYEDDPPVTGGFPSQRASNTENVSIWWRHHATDFSCWVEHMELLQCSVWWMWTTTSSTAHCVHIWTWPGSILSIWYVSTLLQQSDGPINTNRLHCIATKLFLEKHVKRFSPSYRW